MQPSDPIQPIALIMAVTCVRNTIIEKYHAEGKLSDPEMEAFNRQVADRIYTFLYHLMGSRESSAKLLAALQHHFPTNWDLPKKDEGMERAIAAQR